MAVIPMTEYSHVPDSDLEAGDEAAAPVGPVEKHRSRLLGLVLAFVLGFVLSPALYLLFHVGVRAGDELAGERAAVEGVVKSVFVDRPVPTTSSSAELPEPTRDASNRPFLLHFDHEPGMNDAEPIEPPACPIAVAYTQDHSIADAIVYNSDFYSGPGAESRAQMRAERPWQKLVIWGSESAPNRPSLEKYFKSIQPNGTSEMYDADMTYRLNGSVPSTYAYTYMNFSSAPVPYDQKRHDKIAASFVSNCHPKNARNLILDALRENLPGQLDSFGSCKNDASAEDVLKELGRWEDAGDNPTRWNKKITTLGFYKFTIAIENSNDLDYVTEKFYQPLERGSVPIVFGSPDFAARFFPAPNAAIDVAEYLSPALTALSTSKTEEPTEISDEDRAGLRRLAERLRFLASPEGREEYDAMFLWKKDDRWKRESGLGKILALERSYARDCRLAGYLRGQAFDWGRSTWTPP